MSTLHLLSGDSALSLRWMTTASAKVTNMRRQQSGHVLQFTATDVLVKLGQELLLEIYFILHYSTPFINLEYALQYLWIFCNWLNLASLPKVDPLTKIFPATATGLTEEIWGWQDGVDRDWRLEKAGGSSVAIRVRSKEPTNPPEVNGSGDSTSVMVGSISVTTVPKHAWRTCLILLDYQPIPNLDVYPRWFERTRWLVRSSTWGRECVLETQGAFPKMLIMLVVRI